MNESKYFDKVLEKYNNKKGRGYIALDKNDGKITLHGNGYSEEVSDYDIFIETDTGKVENAKDGNLCFVIKSEWKFVLNVGTEYYSCGYDKKNVNKLQSLLVYAKGTDMVFLLYFDVKKSILPLFDYDLDVENMSVEPMLLEKYEETEMDAVTNLYHIILSQLTK